MPGETLHVMDHPLVHHKLARLRDAATEPAQFRALVADIAALLFYEAAKNLPLCDAAVETPLARADALRLKNGVALAPVLRAGIAMADGVLGIMPEASVGHVGVFRDHNTLNPVDYYFKMPGDIARRDVFILDPMLATGGSAIFAASRISELSPLSVTFLCIIAAPEGVKAFTQAFPGVRLYCAALDDRLDGRGYILPGLGDAGDRIFST